MGSNAIESVQLPRSGDAAWSSDGRWLGLCGPSGARAFGAARGQPATLSSRALLVRFQNKHVSAPIPVGDCRGDFEWAPIGARALVHDGSSWRLIDASHETPIVRSIKFPIQHPLHWSPSGRYFVAGQPAPPSEQLVGAVVLVDAREEPRAVPFDVADWRPRWCEWAKGSDQLACQIDRGSRIWTESDAPDPIRRDTSPRLGE
jgi:hypothetical protein